MKDSEKGISETVTCPICSRNVNAVVINAHIDNGCQEAAPSQAKTSNRKTASNLAPIFQARPTNPIDVNQSLPSSSPSLPKGKKRAINDTPSSSSSAPAKRAKMSMQLQSIAPLAERMRPERLDEFVGHVHLTNPSSMFMNGATTGSLGSMIFWGPPGCGKTTLARLYAKRTGSVFKELSATVVGINDIRAVFEEARNTFKLTQRRTVLFLDEIHRFNRSQQDIFLPFVEQGSIQLLGATTENPSFKLTSALLSRCRVFILERLTDADIEKIVHTALQKLAQSSSHKDTDITDNCSEPSSSQGSSTSSGSPPYPQFTGKVIASIVSLASGDARTALSLVELVVQSSLPEADLIASMRRTVSISYDRTGDNHYDMISALHKSVRGSQGTAAMYWLARMLTAGEDPLFVARRMVVCASEDIGLADPHALPLAMSALQACQNIGMPECRINLAHIVAYLSEAPKSTRAYEAYKRAEEAAKLDATLPVPLQVRNAPTKLMDEMGCGDGYRYNPDYAHPVTNTYLPSQLQGKSFLRDEDDKTNKIWDEEALKRWELEENGGQPWCGRKDAT
ncbi:DNA polymerase III, clamp loader complex, gamma/delta/delta subunit [Mucidula mucida]|nr:DNA polymerase III, clamp loader complex, gamma/delta/delta subunit [Mucidula mucida]